jgi:sugar O-acyltransferase (sialic acid O-acetyltransferase NeuD family)
VSTSIRVAIFGAGGMAREVASLLRMVNQIRQQFEFLGYLVSDLSRLSERDSKKEVLGDYDWISKHRKMIDAAILGIGTPTARLRVADEVRSLAPEWEWPSVIHPSAVIDFETASIGEGVFIGAGVIGTVNLVLESFALCNFGSTIGHESRIGRGSVVSPGANISGGVSIGQGVLIGTGAQVLQYRTIGNGARVGAGAVVTKDVAPGQTVIGIPARAVGEDFAQSDDLAARKRQSSIHTV